MGVRPPLRSALPATSPPNDGGEVAPRSGDGVGEPHMRLSCLVGRRNLAASMETRPHRWYSFQRSDGGKDRRNSGISSSGAGRKKRA